MRPICSSPPIPHQVQLCQAPASKARSSVSSLLYPQQVPYLVHLVPLKKSQHRLALPIVLDILPLSAPTPLPPSTSLNSIFWNSSWKGKHPFLIFRAGLTFTLYRFLKKCMHERPGYYSPATFAPHRTQFMSRARTRRPANYIYRGYPRSCAGGTIEVRGTSFFS
jgi:hypothetical protein